MASEIIFWLSFGYLSSKRVNSNGYRGLVCGSSAGYPIANCTSGKTFLGKSYSCAILSALSGAAPRKQLPSPRLLAAVTMFSAMYAASCTPKSSSVRSLVASFHFLLAIIFSNL